MLKHAFYFMIKALFSFWDIAIFVFIRKLRLISKFMTSHVGQQIITIHILFNISSSQCNQAMKIGQLIEYNIRNIFIKNYTQNMVEKLVPDPFIKIKIELISGPIIWNVIKFVFIVCSSRKSTKIYLNESAKHLLLSYIKLLFFF